MGIGQTIRPCAIVLHDDNVSREDVLCGLNVLAVGEVGILIAPNAKTLCIAPKAPPRNGEEVSVHTSIAKRFGLENRTKAKVQVLEVEDDAMATHVEITFRDQHLSRADMWRMKAQTEDKVVYKGQRLKYFGSAAVEVANVYIAGQEVDSAIISHPRTKLIFRSYSARYTILLQVSKEMLQCWTGGDLMFERLVSGFLPELFGRWESMKAHHQITVVLFGRQVPIALSNDGLHNAIAQTEGSEKSPSDFFHVIVSEMPSTDWRLLLRKLRKAFQSGKLPRDVCLAAEGNLLEAIHITAMDFADDNLAPPASSTGTSIIAITAGAGLFGADHHFLKQTTELLLGNSIGVDIVSLSPKPLHPVPLFQYKLESKTEYALPHWLDVSFWDVDHHAISDWLLPGCAEDMMRISTPLLTEADKGHLTIDAMSAYDEDVFCETDNKLEKTASHEATIEKSSQASDHMKSSSNASRQSINGVETTNMQPQIANKPPPRLGTEDQLPNSASTASVPLTSRAKREGLPPHPLMQNFRKISVGPKGLAPSQGVASTTVSAHHVQHEREASATTSPSTENPSLLAKQIRDSLRRKPSQRTLASRQVHEPAEGSRPIAIRTSEELQNESDSTHHKSDPASLIEKAVMERESGPNSGSYSATPKLKRGSLPLPGLSSIDTQDGSNTPWLTLLNPCDPKRGNMRIASEYRKWQNVFPRAVSSGAFKWDSMCSPATLPLMTEVRVSMTDLERYFTKKVRRLLVTPSFSMSSEGAQSVLHELVALRLTAGFQIVPTRKLRKEQTASDHIEKIILALGSQYHELRYLSQAEIQVTEYERPRGAQDGETERSKPADAYVARVRSVLSRKPQVVQITTGSNPFVQDWSVLDDQCANPAAVADEQRICKMRFALIPVQSPGSERTTLSDEERRIDGIQRLTLMWQRHRHIAVEGQQYHASMVKPKGVKIERDPNPLAIEYQTRDPSAVVSGLAATANGPSSNKDGENAEADIYHSSNFDVAKLVKHMQEPPPDGVELRDRRWFTRMHFKCFRGDEMCNWIVRVFKDLDTREDAVILGNQLMDREIFTHVRGKHEFRDGHYLYQIKGAYRTTDYPDNAGFFRKGVGRSMPSTPLAEVKQSPSIRATQGESDSSGKGTPTPASAPIGLKEKKSILLTEKLRYNVDPSKRSEQLEVVDLHYDRIHNPDNCYHIQLDWTSTTPKLIRESVARWASVVEGHGLKLVQLPMKEVCKLHEQHPFDQAVPVKLALRPPKKVPATPLLDAHGASPRAAAEDPLATHKALLRKLDFILDFEAATSFPQTVDVSYSWGRSDFELTQFVHKSGMLLVQIANNGEADFLLLPNRLAPQSSTTSKKTDAVNPEHVLGKFRSFCRDEEALKTFYNEMNKPKVELTSPFSHANRVADLDVPPMELPPHLMHQIQS